MDPLWKNLGMKDDKKKEKQKNILCKHCAGSFALKAHLVNHMKAMHPFQSVPKAVSKYKKVPSAQSQKQREVAAKSRRVHIDKERRPELIKDYQKSMLQGITAEDWGETNKIKNPIKTISRWKKILEKQKQN